MRLNRLPLLVGLILTLTFAGSSSLLRGFSAAQVPASLTNQEFWRLTETLSEPNGSFRSENMLSNEMVLARLMPQVVERIKPGGVYLGVGPEQNFSYLAVTKPKIAFITDIRRGNLHVLLMYKALFELSANRVEFVSRLFSRTMPRTITAASSVKEIMDGVWDAPAGSEAVFGANLKAIQQHLAGTRGLPLPADDITGIADSYRTFYFYGPAMNYSATTSLQLIGRSNAATYWDLMTQTGDDGKPLSYLGSEESFRTVKDMFNRNVIVPLVGNFAGPKTIRAIGDWVRARGATVSAFYVSTVEHYLRDAGTMGTFCANVASLPQDPASVFIRPGNVQQLSMGNAMGANRPDGSRIIIPPGTPTIGTYQIGVVVPIAGGCG